MNLYVGLFGLQGAGGCFIQVQTKFLEEVRAAFEILVFISVALVERRQLPLKLLRILRGFGLSLD